MWTIQKQSGGLPRVSLRYLCRDCVWTSHTLQLYAGGAGVGIWLRGYDVQVAQFHDRFLSSLKLHSECWDQPGFEL